uniref:Uncharacterized protein n=1 Tax=Thermogemmatispora argillosa TaxID=2045280 RepID=A0A455T6F2_9CHLR|nr:hypothetical protein KTA_33580 [Thermogemmatispora argillosa]
MHEATFTSYQVQMVTPEARRVIEAAGGQVVAQPERGGYLVCHPLPETTAETEDGWLLMERAESLTPSSAGHAGSPPSRAGASGQEPCPWSAGSIRVNGGWCAGLWGLAMLLNGLALAKGWQAPPSWLAWGLDEVVAGALLGGWLLLTWWRQQRLWLVGALLLVGALWLASWL